MGLLSAALKAELRTQRPEVYWLLALGYPGGTKRYSTRPVASASLGQYEGKVLRWGTLSRGTNDRAFSLAALEMTVTIDDTDRSFADLIEGASGHLIEGSTAVLQLASPAVAAGDWFTAFTGVVDQYEFDSTTSYVLRMRTNDRVLRRYAPKEVITQAVWPNAHPDVRGKAVPRLYGTFDSGGGGGALPTLLVDILGDRHMVCGGHGQSVDRVFNAGIHATTGFTISYPVVGGRTYTLVDWTAAVNEYHPVGSITVDAKGYATGGDGSGTLIENPADQLKHDLVNWVWGDYKTGPWLADSTAPINTTWFAEAAAFLAARGHKGSRYLAGAQREGITDVNEWCASFQCRAFWTALGQLAIRVEDHGLTSIYLDDPWLKWHRDLDDFRLRYDTQQRIDRVTGRYLRNEVTGDYTQALEVRDPSITRDAPDSLDLSWSHGSVA